MQTKEANGYALTKPYVVALDFVLTMDCDAYTWRFGNAEFGESAGEIVWYRKPAVGVHAMLQQSTGSSVIVRTEVYNTTNAAEVCRLYVVAYGTDGRIVAMNVEDGYTVGSEEFLWGTYEISSDETIAEVRVFLMEENYAPIAPAVPLQVK